MQTLVDAAIELTQGAGAILLRHHRAGTAVVSHKAATDLVTTADHESEAHVLRELARRFPDHAVLAEESGHGRRDGPYRWLCDPLDGTNNFAHGLPHFAVLLAVQERASDGRFETIVGATLDPVRGELFLAVRGQGATLNGAPIRVSSIGELIESAASTGFSPKRLFQEQDNHREYCRMNLVTQGVRRFGSAGLDLAYVACGRFDLFWEFQLNPWDLAAGVLLAREAGGQVTAPDGRPFDLFEGAVLATNGRVHGPSLAALASARDLPAASREGLEGLLPPELGARLCTSP